MLTLKTTELPTDCPTHKGLISWGTYRTAIEEALEPYDANNRKHVPPDYQMSYREAEDTVRFLHYFMTVVIPYGPIGAELPCRIWTVSDDHTGEWFVELETVPYERWKELGVRFVPTRHWFGSPEDAVLWATLKCAIHGIDRVSWVNDIAAQILGGMSSGDRSCCHHKVPKEYRQDMTEKHRQEWIDRDVTSVNGGDGR